MSFPRRALRWQLGWVLLVAGSGCTLVSDLERFETSADAGEPGPGSQDGGAEPGGDAGHDAGHDADADGGGGNTDAGTADAGSDAGPADAGDGEPVLGCENPRTLCVRLSAYTPHVDQLTVIDLVSEDDNLRARAVLDPLNGVDPTADVVLPLAIPELEVPAAGMPHPLHLEIWADNDNDGVYAPDGDHDWNVPLPESGNRNFTHSSAFSDLVPRPASIGGDFVMHFTEMAVHKGLRLEVMVIEDATDRTVGLYRLERIPDSGTFTITIPDIVDTGEMGGIVYRVEFYADANGDRNYDDPPDDHTWLRFVESNSDGVEFEFSHGLDFTPLDYQFDFEE